MMRILVDTSVWVDHFKNGNHHLVNLLMQDDVMTHPMIIGEISCGTPPDRENLIVYFLALQRTYAAPLEDMLDFVAKAGLYGRGCGFVDIHVLWSVLMTPNVKLWTLDKRLAQLAQQFDVSYIPFVH